MPYASLSASLLQPSSGKTPPVTSGFTHCPLHSGLSQATCHRLLGQLGTWIPCAFLSNEKGGPRGSQNNAEPTVTSLQHVSGHSGVVCIPLAMARAPRLSPAKVGRRRSKSWRHFSCAELCYNNLRPLQKRIPAVFLRRGVHSKSLSKAQKNRTSPALMCTAAEQQSKTARDQETNGKRRLLPFTSRPQGQGAVGMATSERPP